MKYLAMLTPVLERLDLLFIPGTIAADVSAIPEEVVEQFKKLVRAVSNLSGLLWLTCFSRPRPRLEQLRLEVEYIVSKVTYPRA